MKIDERSYIIGFAVNSYAHNGLNDEQILICVNDMMKRMKLEQLTLNELQNMSKINLYAISMSYKSLYFEKVGKEMLKEEFINEFGFDPTVEGIDKL